MYLLISTFSSPLKAQTKLTDSLKKALPLLSDRARVDCLNELGFEYSNPYWNHSTKVNTDTALIYTLQAQKESQQLNYSPGIGKSFQNLGMVEEEHGDFFKSEYYTALAISLLEKNNMQTELNRARINLGYCFYHQGRYKEAIEIYQKELPYYKAVKDSSHLSMIYRMIGKVYGQQGYTENVFRYFQKNFEITKNKDQILRFLYTPGYSVNLIKASSDTVNALLYFNQSNEYLNNQHMELNYYYETLSNIYSLKKQYDSAISCFHQINTFINSTYSDSSLKKIDLLRYSIRLAELYILINDFDHALVISSESSAKFAKGGDIVSLMPVLKNIATAYDLKSDYENSLYYTKQLLEIAEATGSRPFVRDGYLLLSDLYQRKNQSKLASNYRIKYTNLSDTIQQEDFKSKFAAWDLITKMYIEEEKYITQLKIAESQNNTTIVAVNKEKKIQLIIFISALIIGFLFTGVFIRNIKLKRRKDQLQLLMTASNAQLEKRKIEQEIAALHMQKTELEMQALRAQMNPHFIFNSLNAINCFILENNKTKASEYLTKFSRLVRLILQNSQSALISLEKELEALKLYLQLEALRFDNHFDFAIIVDKELDTLAIKVPPLIIQPFAENAVWHGLMHKEQKGYVQIELYEEGNMLYCKITDDGIGRKKAVELKSKSAASHKSMGMQITANRIAMLEQNEDVQTQIKINDLVLANGSAGGTEVILKIPVCYD